MDKLKLQLLAVGLIIALVLSGCSFSGSTNTTAATSGSLPTSAPTGNSTSAPSGNSLAGAVDLMADYQGKGWGTAEIGEPVSAAINGMRRFSAALFAESAKNKGNVLVSPVSVFLALAMTLNGADNETRTAMLATLADQGITVEMLNELSRFLIVSLAETNNRKAVEIANSIWLREGFQANSDFLQANADYFRAGATSLDFADPAATELINNWVDANTHGLIKKIIEKINPTTVMLLINTLYFKSDWQLPFLHQDTRPGSFETPAGPVEAKFMHQTGKLRYFSGSISASGDNTANPSEKGNINGNFDEIVGIALPYVDGQFTYFAFLTDPAVAPRTWLQAREQTKLFSELAGLMAQKSNFSVALTLPKYEAEFDDSLVDDLSELGMDIVFDGSRADFSLLPASGSKGLFISEVKHKTFIRVDEKGTEAAAATSVAVDESLPMFDKELVFDRPFIYGIMDSATKLPLFVGILENPVA
ncbi:MAG: serpin family protein [Saccharofermentanales bacterium]